MNEIIRQLYTLVYNAKIAFETTYDLHADLSGFKADSYMPAIATRVYIGTTIYAKLRLYGDHAMNHELSEKSTLFGLKCFVVSGDPHHIHCCGD